MNPLQQLHPLGQSVWLDYIRRHLLDSGELERLVQDDGLRGVTSNPAIFEKAIAGSSDYTESLAQAREADPRAEPMALYEGLAIADIQRAADILRPVYNEGGDGDGCVSLEVSPSLAHDTAGTVADARRLWAAVNRPNVMIKIPATAEGLPAVTEVIGGGINVNVTLLFAVPTYERVVEAYLLGLEKLAAAGGDVSRIASVASFFLSRIDATVDALLGKRIKTAANPAEVARLQALLGKAAIASAKAAYASFGKLFRGPRWEALRAKDAHPQRLLWASTSTKNPRYRDTLYIEEIIGPDTVNTVPPATLDAFRAHGVVRGTTLLEGADAALGLLAELGAVGVDLKQVTDGLLTDGLAQFSESFDKLLAAVGKHQEAQAVPPLHARQTFKLPPEMDAAVRAALDQWEKAGKTKRLWEHDASLWTRRDEADWLGWLSVPTEQLARPDHLTAIAADVRAGDFDHLLLLGMGGSSLCPDVLRRTFGQQEGFPELLVLDSTDPAQIAAVQGRINPARTLFIVSSKSGGTLEPNIFRQYFHALVCKAPGVADAGKRFIAITDPGSGLEKTAGADGFRHIFYGLPSIGGRYSALSDFGMVPAAMMGLDVKRFLEYTTEMVHACEACVPDAQNPGVSLGVLLGTLATRFGRDKVTLVASPGIAGVGAWLEQLLAESTGKDGRGLIPVDDEPLGAPEVYGDDRVFAYLRLEPAPDPEQEHALAALEAAGQPVVRITLLNAYDLGQQFFGWEIATAVAGSLLGINAFNQPDVEASKLVTKQLTTEYEQQGHLPFEKSFFQGEGVQLFADAKNADALRRTTAAANPPGLPDFLRAHLGQLGAGDYFALLAYVEMNDTHQAALQAIRIRVRDARRVATCLGFGPRFLHSTGQAYKGGPNSGVFLQITCEDAHDLPVPGQRYSFGVVKTAQARGDFAVLAERGRRALRVHLGPDVAAGLTTLAAAIEQALGSSA